MISARRILTIVGTLFTALAAGFMMQYIMSNPDERAQGVQVASVAPASSQPVTDAVPDEPVLAQAPTLDDAETFDSAARDEAVAVEAVPAQEAPEEAASVDQDTVELASTSGASTEILQESPAHGDAPLAQDVPQPPTVAPQPDALPADPLTLASLDDTPTNLVLPGEEPTPSFICDTKVVAQTSAAAMVDLIIDAACQDQKSVV